MINIDASFSWNEKHIVRTFPEEGVEFNGEKYLKEKKYYNRLLSYGILLLQINVLGMTIRLYI